MRAHSPYRFRTERKQPISMFAVRPDTPSASRSATMRDVARLDVDDQFFTEYRRETFHGADGNDVHAGEHSAFIHSEAATENSFGASRFRMPAVPSRNSCLRLFSTSRARLMDGIFVLSRMR